MELKEPEDPKKTLWPGKLDEKDNDFKSHIVWSNEDYISLKEETLRIENN